MDHSCHVENTGGIASSVTATCNVTNSQIPKPPAQLLDQILLFPTSTHHALCLLCIDLVVSVFMAAFQASPWKLISGILAIMCLLLMTTLSILLKNSFIKQNIQPAFTPGPTIELQKGSDCCSCPERWFGYRCKCYFFSNEEKTWAESRDFCASQNSSLLQLEGKQEFDFRISSKHYYWIGLSYNKINCTWLWEDGSIPSWDLFSQYNIPDPESCILYKPNATITDAECGMENHFICKKQFI
ncbi:PREDICTED: natural killer cells antigen CD94-like [Chrysochloris asiatica]|uniref:Natural killer cells antigen CD94 n=1 Tax=Chrysochloris asiatica TaxID=185453 RepID=A0A9B0U4B3_CHRAS|nr:PREDICTED: natural killer cells antigen CD94-like [Chrysochloris asiatica]